MGSSAETRDAIRDMESKAKIHEEEQIKLSKVESKCAVILKSKVPSQVIKAAELHEQRYKEASAATGAQHCPGETKEFQEKERKWKRHLQKDEVEEKEKVAKLQERKSKAEEVKLKYERKVKAAEKAFKAKPDERSEKRWAAVTAAELKAANKFFLLQKELQEEEETSKRMLDSGKMSKRDAADMAQRRVGAAKAALGMATAWAASANRKATEAKAQKAAGQRAAAAKQAVNKAAQEQKQALAAEKQSKAKLANAGKALVALQSKCKANPSPECAKKLEQAQITLEAAKEGVKLAVQAVHLAAMKTQLAKQADSDASAALNQANEAVAHHQKVLEEKKDRLKTAQARADKANAVMDKMKDKLERYEREERVAKEKLVKAGLGERERKDKQAKE